MALKLRIVGSNRVPRDVDVEPGSTLQLRPGDTVILLDADQVPGIQLVRSGNSLVITYSEGAVELAGFYGHALAGVQALSPASSVPTLVMPDGASKIELTQFSNIDAINLQLPPPSSAIQADKLTGTAFHGDGNAFAEDGGTAPKIAKAISAGGGESATFPSTGEEGAPSQNQIQVLGIAPAEYTISPQVVREGASMVFTVKRTGGLAPETVQFETTIGSADVASGTSGSDFTAVKGTVTFAAGQDTGTFTVMTTHDAIVEGSETFTVTLSNASAAGRIPSPTTTGTILNNTDPTAAADIVVALENAGTGNLVPALLGNDSEPDAGDSIRILSVDLTGTLGTVTFDAATQTLSYSASYGNFASLAPGQVIPGSDSFSYTVVDGGNATSTATVSITLTGVNQAPTLAGITASTTINDIATTTPFGAVVIGDVDLPPQTFDVSVTLDSSAKGAFTTLNGFSNPTPGVYTFTGTAAAAEAAIHGLVYDPSDNRVASGASETTTFTITVDDGFGFVQNSTTHVTAISVNDAPTVGSIASTLAFVDSSNLPASQAVTLVSTLVDATHANVVDVDAQPLKGVAVTGFTGTGLWEFSIDGVNFSALGAVSPTAARLLSATASVRYTPVANEAGNATLTYQAWDETTGAIGGTGNATANGGNTAFSTLSSVATHTVASVNDAPVLDASKTPVLAAVPEDSGAPGVGAGTLVSSLVDFPAPATGLNNVTDPDAGAVPGIAVTATNATNGTWLYSTDGGTNWNAIGSVSATGALLLAADANTRVYFQPAANFDQTASLTFRAWDGSDGNPNGTAGIDTSLNGGQTAFSASTDTATVTVTPVNDAPVVATIASTLANVDSSNAVATPQTTAVSALVTNAAVTDVDSGALTGIAITGISGAGTWSFSTDGVTYTPMGAVSTGSARLVASTGFVRYTPAANETDSATLTYLAWDQTSGANGTLASTTVNGGITAFSSTASVATHVVAPVNDAPVLDASKTPVLAAVAEDAAAPVGAVGTLISSLVDFASPSGQVDNVTDPDVGPLLGIAITAVNAANGNLFFSTDNGANWNAIGSVTAASALLLAADANTRIYLQPSPVNFNGTITNAITFRAWDRTSGANGGTADTTANGGLTAFSVVTDTANITVTPVNDAPVVATIASTLANVDSSNAVATPQTTAVSALVTNAAVTDVDSGALTGIAITGISGAGTWSFSTDGVTYTPMGAVSTGSARLVASTGFVRYTPAANETDSATLTYLAWDQTSGSNGGTASTTVNGGITAFSSTASVATHVVAPVNDAPVLDASKTPVLAAVAEDAAAPTGAVGTLVSSLVDLAVPSGQVDNITDPDVGPLLGIAITAVNAANGNLFFSTDNGANWNAIGSVTAASALLLAADANTRIYLQPSPVNFNGTITNAITFRAWDQTSGANGGTADTTANGGLTAFSVVTDTANITVTPVNDAPVVATIASTLANVDSSNAVATPQTTAVSALVTNAAVTDVDSGALTGIAITGISGAGTWSFSTDGVTYTPMGAVSTGSARLVASTGFVRYTPAANETDSATLTYLAWDQTSGANGTLASTTVNGGITAFSSTASVATHVVAPVNDAPVLDASKTPVLAAVAEDAAAPVGAVGTLISSLVDFASPSGQVDNVTDPDVGPLLGIAITAVNAANGNLFFSTDNGANWNAIGSVTAASALLLAADANTRIYLQPSPVNFNGTITNAITFRAWDRTSGANGGTADTTANGGQTAFSLVTDTANITVTPVNDAPVVATTTSTLANVDSSNAVATPQTTAVSALVTNAAVTDIDSGALTGVAITATSGAGTWSFSTDGVTYTPMGAVSTGSARLVASTGFVRYTPAANETDSATLTYLAWDQTSGSNGGTASTTVNGGITAFSSAASVATHVVAPVNDAPVLDASKTPVLAAAAEDAAVPVGAVGTLISSLVDFASPSGQVDNVTDPDVSPLLGIAITAVDGANGTWSYTTNGGTTWNAVGAVTATSALLLAADANTRLHFQPNADFNGTVTNAITFRAWDQTSGSNGGTASTATNGGQTAFSVTTDTANITVTPVNDAPVVATIASTLANVDSSNAVATPQTTAVSALVTNAAVTDVDSGALTGIAITGISGAGTWAFSTTGAGGPFTTISGVADATARLLSSTAFVRYTPAANETDNATLTYRAWDQSSGANGGTASATTNGGITAFSSTVSVATHAVAPVNDAPVLDASKTPAFAAVAEDAAAPVGAVGTLISSLVDFASPSGQVDNVTDPDVSPLLGIAITAVDTGNGTWSYTTNGGTTWNAVGAVSANSALLLAADANTRLYFQPTTLNFNGTVPSAITFRAWDRTSGANGGTADTTANGGLTAFSVVTDTANITVTPVNDAPVVATIASTLANVDSSNAVATPQTTAVSALVTNAAVTDVDSGALTGIAITGISGAGTWSFSTDGVTYTPMGAVSTGSARLVASTGFVRYTPAANETDSATLTYLAWDQTSGANGTLASTTVNGGITAFSSTASVATHVVAPVNDAPVLDASKTPVLAAVAEDAAAPVGAVGTLISSLVDFASPSGQVDNVTDPDVGPLLGIAITAVNAANGNLFFSTDNGANWNAIGSVTAASALLLAADANTRIYLQPSPVNFNGTITNAITFRAWDRTSGANGGTADTTANGGLTAFSVVTDTANITVTPVNDAPVVATIASTLANVDSSNAVATPQTTAVSALVTNAAVTDVDSGALTGIAITGISGAGTWSFSTDGVTYTPMGAVSTGSARLVASTGFVRYTPAANETDSATLTYLAWDQTSGSNGGTASTTVNGGITAFSSTASVATHVVAPVNDAPVLDASKTPVLAAVAEDAAAPTGAVGTLVSSLVDLAVPSGQVDNITDPDVGPLLGIAITAVNAANGNLFFSTDNGANWNAIGSVTAASALLLAADANTRIYLQPSPVNFNGTITNAITFRAWDQTSGANGGTADTTANGGLTAFSVVTDTANITVTPVNDAPVVATIASTLANVDSSNAVATPQTTAVSALVTNAAVTDVDSGALTGIAITGISGAGTWSFSTDGVTYTPMGAVSTGSARLVASTGFVRYTPAANETDSATLTYLAWDQTSGANGTLASTTVNGGITAFSSTASVATHVVAPVNDAPVLDASKTPVLAAVAEDAAAPVGAVGTLISSLVDFASPSGQVDNVTDPDVGPLLGIAITAVNAANGNLFFSTDNGANWNAIGSVTAASALLLAADANTRIYLQPSPVNFNGTITNAITFRAWDRTSGANGGTADTTANGGLTAFSVVTDTANITVTPVNDAPVVATIASTLANVDSSNAVATPQTTAVSALVTNAAVTDVDSGALTGIAITGISGAGTWSFSTDGVTYTPMGAVSTGSARLVASTGFVRYTPAANETDSATLTYLAWDQTSGSNGGTASTTVNGGITAFSSTASVATHVVAPVNDAPVLDASKTPVLAAVAEDAAAPTGAVGTLVSSLVDLAVPSGQVDNITDPDVGPLLGIAITAVNAANGNLFFSTDNGANWNAIGSVTAASALLLAADANTRIYLQPSPVNFNGTITNAITFRAWDQTSGANGGTADTTANGGLTAFSVVTDTANITVTPVNDAPVVATIASTLANVDSSNAVATPQTTAVSALVTNAAVTDVDSGALTGIAITGISGAGTWSFSTDGVTYTPMGAVSTGSARLVASTGFVRYTPAANETDSATLTYLAWDQTSGSNGGTASTTVNGGITAFSSTASVATHVVAPVNDAPVLDASKTPVLAAVAEDAAAPTGAVGTLVSSLVDLAVPSGQVDNVTDPDVGPLLGIAITAVNAANGNLFFSTDNGANWNAIGSVTAASALLLAADANTRIYLQPSPVNFNGTITNAITFRAWDRTSGANGGTADTTANGGLTAFSVVTDTANITVTPVNDAPVVATIASTLANVDSSNAVATPQTTAVSALVTNAAVTDVDSGALTGIAITGISGAGTWAFSTTGAGGPFTTISGVADATARLLSSTAFVRYTPAANETDNATLTYRAWDQSSGANGGTASATTNGGITAFSSTVSVATHAVAPVNDAPVLDASKTPAFAAVAEDAAAPTGAVGTLVSSLVDLAVPSGQVDNITDPDVTPLLGIAITALDTSNGSWSYTTNGGTTWNAVGAVSANSALLLAADANTRLHFQPNADFNGTVTNAITFRAWDQTSGSNGGTASTATNGGQTAFSVTTDTANITVTPVNDAPVVATIASTLANVDSSNAVATPQTTAVSALVTNAAVTDVDSGALTGIAITGISGAGTWSFSTTGAGGPFTTISGVADATARLLSSTAFVRYTPAANETDNATLTYRAWDQSSGANGGTASATTNGGITAFSSTVSVATHAVAPVNDAPVLDASKTPVLAAVGEDAAAPVGAVGTLVSSLVDLAVPSGQVDNITDPDVTPLLGIAITAVNGANGIWSYTTDGGTTWNAVGAVTPAGALLLAADANTRLYFQPTTLNFNGTVTSGITFRAWDQTSGSNGGTADTAAANGGLTAFSLVTDTANITVTPVNDAPVVATTTSTLANVDSSNAVATPQTTAVSALVTNAAVTDVDSGALKGIAITATSGAGTWSFSTDGVTYTPMGAVSTGSARLVASTGFVRYTPAANETDSATLTYLAWDQTSGANGGTASTTVNGGITAFSSTASVATHVVAPVNDAPVLDASKTPVLAAVGEDAAAPVGAVGTLVSSLVDLAVPSGQVDNITDPDVTPLLGIAITAVNGANGIWSYTTNGGTTWNAVGAVTPAGALLLAADANTRLHFQPNADFNGTVTSGITFRAWDQTSGSNGGTADTAAANGGLTAFSLVTDTANITVTPVNDAPVVATTTSTLANVDSSNAVATPQTTAVSALVTNAAVTDVDSGALKGIAITATSGAGTWSFSTDGVTYTPMGAVSTGSARLVASTGFVRYTPAANETDSATLTYLAWDQTSGANGTLASTTVNGGITAFSSTASVATHVVAPVNDAPVLDASKTPVLAAVGEDAAAPVGAVGTLVSSLVDLAVPSGQVDNITDPDVTPLLGIAITAVNGANGIWSYTTNGGTTWNAVGAVTPAGALLLAADANTRLHFQPNADFNGTVTSGITFRAWDQTSGSNGGTADTAAANGGLTAFSLVTDTANITVTPVNDAPVVATTTSTLANVDSSNAVATPQTTAVSALVTNAAVTDVDSGALTGIAITGISGAGTWSFSTTGAGGPFTTISGVADATARLLSSTAFVRYTPAANETDSATLTYRAWDQSSGSNGGTASATTNGGITAFSSTVSVATHAVAPVNDAPVLDTNKAPVLAGEAPASPAPVGAVGTLVSSLVDFASPSGQVDNVTDPDVSPLLGIAVTGLDEVNGSWFFTTDGGANWNAIGAGTLASSTALLLAADANTRLYFQPTPVFTGTVTDAVTFRAWDQTSGSNGATGVNTTVNGGQTAFSAATDTANITIAAVNIAPVLDATKTPVLGTILEDAVAPPTGVVGTLVSSLVDFALPPGQVDNVTDGNAGALLGIAVVALNNANGSWYYTTNNGGSWTAFGSVTPSSATLLAADGNTRVYFAPALNFNGTVSAALGFRAWDQTSGSNGATGVDTTTNGGTTAFSVATDTATITVTAVNDAPVVTGMAGTANYTLLGTAVAVDGTITLSDVDSANFAGATVSITAGFVSGDSLNFSSVSGINGVYNTSTGVLTLTGTTTQANYQAALDTITFSTTNSTTGNRTVVVIVNDGTDPSAVTAQSTGIVSVSNGTGLTPTVQLSGLDGSLTSGFRLDGIAANDQAGVYVSGLGDVNGDGIADYVVSALKVNSSSGQVYAVYGTNSTVGASLQLSGVGTTTAGFRASGSTGDSAGTSVASAGDINGDGYADVIVGAPSAAGGLGKAYVIFGAPGLTGSFNLSGSGISYLGSAAFSGTPLPNAGTAVASAGDINSDGFDDFIISTPFAAPGGQTAAGSVYVIYGKASGLASANLDAALLDGTKGFTLNGVTGSLVAGSAVGSAGDVNGDGFDDFLIGAPSTAASPQAYLVFGKAGAFAAASSLNSAFLNGTNGIVINGSATLGNRAGTSVSAAGDINGDGYGDFIVGMPGADGGANGVVGVFFGKSAAAWAATPTMAITSVDLNGTAGFRIAAGQPPQSQLGTSVRSVGDVNGDGYDDILVGGNTADPNGDNSGISYLVFGKATWAATLNLTTTPPDGINVIAYNGAVGSDSSGTSVGKAGDINNDGFDDFMIGAPLYDAAGGTDTGAGYVVYGRDFRSDGTTPKTLTATAIGQSLVGGLGTDTLSSAGFTGVTLRGGAGNDTLVVTGAERAVDGGGGSDTLKLASGTSNLDFSAIGQSKITNVEAIDLRAGGGNTLTLSARDVLDMSGTTHTLLVRGDAGAVGTGDQVIATTAGQTWVAGADQVVNGIGGGATYHSYTIAGSTAHLLIENTIANITL